eukprot:TRINITY_DN7522_c0_g1_i1.p1 TRINITY_DN7522_c0_g1~~TRINITY_DN7522_c0_g1_i1.p1  ORF type:complete len:596 (+),score=106.83 TRINITY_DN7522_c0_g1_i1:42-1790(+)
MAKRSFSELTGAIQRTTDLSDSLSSLLTDPFAVDEATLVGIEESFLELKEHTRFVRASTEDQKALQQNKMSQYETLDTTMKNFLYESDHFQREIQTCRTLPAAVRAISMVPEEEFTAEHALLLSQEELNDEHLLMLRRLSHELSQRTDLLRELSVIEGKLISSKGDSRKQKELIGSLPKSLFELKKTMAPIETALGLQTSAEHENNRKAQQLPPPLYNLYQDLTNLLRTSPNLGVTCKVLRESRSHQSYEEALNIPPEKSGYNIFLTAPTSLHLSFSTLLPSPTRPFKSRTDFKVHYLPHLSLMAILPFSASSLTHTSFHDDILRYLVPGDEGSLVPHVAGDISPPESLGCAFKWLQKLGGDSTPPESASPAVSPSKTPSPLACPGSDPMDVEETGSPETPLSTLPLVELSDILKRIHDRIRNFKSLRDQLKSLSNLRIYGDHSPVAAVLLKSWDEVTPSSSRGSTRNAKDTEVEEGEITSTSKPSRSSKLNNSEQSLLKTYYAKFKVGSDSKYSIRVRVRIAPDYPHTLPALRISGVSSHLSSKKNSHSLSEIPAPLATQRIQKLRRERLLRPQSRLARPS